LRRQIVTLCAVAAALAASAAPASAGPGATWTSIRAAPSASAAVLLPTGDQVIVRRPADGSAVDSVRPAAASGIGRAIIGLTLGGHRYEIPAVAAPYLNNGLDLSLFDVTSLAAVETGATIPIQVGYAGAEPAIPGLTVTGRTANSVSGYLTAAGAERFGAALTREYLAARAGNPAGSGPFGQHTTVGLAGATESLGTAQPQFAMHTVTIAGTDNDALVFLINVDDANRLRAITGLYQGVAKFSAPAGHYLAVVLYADTDAAGEITAIRAVVHPELAISGNQTVRMEEKQATSRLTVATPRPSTSQGGVFHLLRTDALGAPTGIALPIVGGAPFWISPTSAPVHVGAMHSYPALWLSSPAQPTSSSAPYSYELQFETDGVIPRQHYVAKAADLATIDSSFYSEVKTSTLLDVFSAYPFESALGGTFFSVPIDLPARRIIYVVGDAGLWWQFQMVKYTVQADGLINYYGGQLGGPVVYHRGESVHESWNQFPLHPASQAALGTPADTALGGVLAGARRTGDTVRFTMRPFSDNQRGHLGDGFYGEATDTITGGWELDENGAKVAGGPVQAGAFDLDEQAKASPGRSTLRLTLDAARTGPMYTLSTASHTEWTWRSAHRRDTVVPAPWICGYTDTGVDKNCAIEPLMTLSYAVDTIDLTGLAPGGRQGIGITVGHLSGAPSAKIVGAGLQYSTDDGATWHNATTWGDGNGAYHSSFSVAGASTPYVSLRVTARDAAGGAITETVTRAYRWS